MAITLTYWKNKDVLNYDIVAYTSYKVPMRCVTNSMKHWNELAPSAELGWLYRKMPIEEWGKRYVDELLSEHGKELERLAECSDAGTFIQILFLEEDKEDGERKWLYEALRHYTNNVYIE